MKFFITNPSSKPSYLYTYIEYLIFYISFDKLWSTITEFLSN